MPYTVSTSLRFSYFGSLIASLCASIQAFWFAASGAAERIAYSPPSSPRMSSARSAITVPVSSKSTWAMKTLSPSPDGTGESHETTVAPASEACLTAGSIWSPAQFEIMTPLTPCVPALVTVSICPETQLSGDDGPRYSAGSTWSSPAASVAPSFAWSNTAMPVCFGMKTDLNSLPGASLPSALVSAAPPPSAAGSSSSSPQPAATSANAASTAASNHMYRFI